MRWRKPCATVVVFVSIVEGTLGEPTAAEAVGTLQSLYASGELQQALAAVGITDELAGRRGSTSSRPASSATRSSS